MIKVSIIIPTFNSATTIEQTLNSIIGQTSVPKEVLCMDAASSDNTVEIIKKYTGTHTFIKCISEPDNGIYDAMNKGIKLATGDYLYFMGSNDVFFDKKILEEVFSGPANHVDFLYGNVLLKDQNKLHDGIFDLEKLIKYENISHQAIFYHRSIFSKIGSFNTDYKICADHDLNIRCFLNPDIAIKFIDKTIALFDQQGISSTKEDKPFQRKRILKVIELYEDPIVVYQKYRSFDQTFQQLISSKDYRLGHLILNPFRALKRAIFGTKKNK